MADAVASHGGHLRLEGNVTQGQVVTVAGPGGARAVFKLPAGVAADALSLSPSGRHALVYAKLKKGEVRTATVIDVSDVDSTKVTGTFKPGVGGEWRWSPTDTIILTAGCGTSCAQVLVHDLQGTKLAQVLCDGFDEATELSTDRRYVACFSTAQRGDTVDGGELKVVDTTSGKIVRRVHLPCLSLGGGLKRDYVKFEAGGAALRLQCHDPARKRDVSIVVAWTTGRPPLTTTLLR